MQGSISYVSNSTDLNSGLIVNAGESPRVARVKPQPFEARILTNIPINIQSATLSADFDSNESFKLSFRDNIVV